MAWTDAARKAAAAKRKAGGKLKSKSWDSGTQVKRAIKAGAVPAGSLKNTGMSPRLKKQAVAKVTRSGKTGKLGTAQKRHLRSEFARVRKTLYP